MYKVEVTWLKRSPVTMENFDCEKVEYSKSGPLVFIFAKKTDDTPIAIVNQFQSVKIHESIE